MVRRLRTPRTARVVEVGLLRPATEVVYLACHGYGMDVERFAGWLVDLPESQAAICPEGLSRFYWGGFQGRVVASWMTRGERLHEIDDFCAWLDRVYDYILDTAPTARLVPLGFSQGAATIMRWLDRRRPNYERIVLWSGTPPEDIDYVPRHYFEQKSLRVYWGETDELITWPRAVQRFAEVRLPFEYRSTAGGHRIARSAWRALTEEMSQ